MKVRSNSLEYEKIVDDRKYTIRKDTAYSVKYEWEFDDYTLIKIIDKSSGLITWKKVNKGKRKSGNREILKSDKPFVMLYETAIEALETEVITFDEYAVLVSCANLIDWHDYRYVVDRIDGTKLTIRGLSQRIHKRYETLLNLLKSLEKKGFIELESTGNATYILVSSKVAYKGKLDKEVSGVTGDKSRSNPTNINKGMASKSQKDDVHYHKNGQPLSQKRIMNITGNGVMTEAEADFEYFGGNK